MTGMIRDVLSIAFSTTPSGSARLTNFNPDRILFIVKGASAITKADLKKIVLTTNFKNSVGSGIAVTNNLPLDFVANLNDYLYGFGLLGSDLTAAFVLDIGKYILKSDDEITITIGSTDTLSQSVEVYVKACDTFIGKEQLISWKYIKASATQAYQESSILEAYCQIASPSDTTYMTIDDFYGSNNVSELAVCGLASALGNAEDYDGLGLIFNDPTHLSQPVTVRAGSSNEEILFKQWNFDINRLGFEKTDDNNVNLLAEAIASGNPVKARCLKYFYS